MTCIRFSHIHFFPLTMCQSTGAFMFYFFVSFHFGLWFFICSIVFCYGAHSSSMVAAVFFLYQLSFSIPHLVKFMLQLYFTLWYFSPSCHFHTFVKCDWLHEEAGDQNSKPTLNSALYTRRARTKRLATLSTVSASIFMCPIFQVTTSIDDSVSAEILIFFTTRTTDSWTVSSFAASIDIMLEGIAEKLCVNNIFIAR